MKIIKAFIIALFLSVVYISSVMPLKPAVLANLKIYDLLFSITYSHRSLPHDVIDKMVLVSIDDESFKNMSLRWPWSRGVLAGMIKNISECSPSLICLDMVFIGKSMDENQDLIVAKSIQDAKNVIAAAYFGDDGRYIVPENIIAAQLKDLGFVDKPRDIDNVARRTAPYIITKPGNIHQYCMPLVTAAAMVNKNPADIIRDNPRLKERDIYINFYGNLNKFTIIPAWKIFKEKKADLAKILKDKVVFVGTSTEVIHDIHPTPMGIMSGVVITMNEAIGYATANFSYPAGRNINFIIILVFVFAAILAQIWLRPIQGMILFAADLIIFLAVSLIALSHNIILDYFGVLFLVSFSAFFFYTHKYIMMILENAALKREAVTDGLTNLYVYRYFELCLKKELKKATEGRGKLALVFYDIDHFKRINDTYGHEFGNQVLRTIAKTLKENTRSMNTLARYGGEEFCVLMPETSAREVVIYAERIRNAIKKLEFKTDKGEAVNVTISGGIVTSENNENITQYTNFVKAADSALYRSKETGRDKVSVYDKTLDAGH